MPELVKDRDGWKRWRDRVLSADGPVAGEGVSAHVVRFAAVIASGFWTERRERFFCTTRIVHEKTDISDRQVRRGFQELVSQGFLECDRRDRRNWYRLTIPDRATAITEDRTTATADRSAPDSGKGVPPMRSGRPRKAVKVTGHSGGLPTDSKGGGRTPEAAGAAALRIVAGATDGAAANTDACACGAAKPAAWRACGRCLRTEVGLELQPGADARVGASRGGADPAASNGAARAAPGTRGEGSRSRD